MNDTTTDTRFAGFEYEATELSAYIFSLDTFIISLKDERIIRFVAQDPEKFRKWLVRHRIRDAKEEVGAMIYHYYFPKEGRGKG